MTATKHVVNFVDVVRSQMENGWFKLDAIS